MAARRETNGVTNREIEVKLRISDVAEMHRKLLALGATYRGRVHERNTVYDTAASDFRRRGGLLRIREETPAPNSAVLGPQEARRHSSSMDRRTILTSKATPPPGGAGGRRYKEKLERELVVPGSPDRWHGILRGLGLKCGFRYEKFRSIFGLFGLILDLDETPAGAFIEIEGQPRAIDRAARSLGFTPRDYYRGTYWDVYVAECRRRGRTPRNMLFGAKKFAKTSLFA
jgi:adenylate cyclase class IV